MLVDRRSFLKSLGVLGATSVSLGTLLGCNNAPREKLYAYLTPPADLLPGISGYYATVCRACPAGCGLMVKTREGRPVKLEGNPLHPLNRGTLCARGQAFIQGLYSRDRVKVPLRKSGADFQEISWEEAYQAIVSQRESSKSALFLTGLESGSFEDVLADFMSSFDQGQIMMYEPFSLQSLSAASQLIFSTPEVPFFDFSGVDKVISFGADFLDAWVSPVQFSQQWSIGRSLDGESRMDVEYFGPRRNLTATAADRWYKLSPDEVADMLLLLAYELGSRKSSGSEENQTMMSLISQFGEKPELPQSLDGFDFSSFIEGILASQQPLVLFGGCDVSGEEATRSHLLALLINSMLGSLGSAIQYGRGYVYSQASPTRDVVSALNNAASGKWDMVFIYGTNPVYSLPGGVDAAKKLEDSSFVVALADRFNETVSHADIILPVHHPLESWGDYEVTTDIVGLMQPVRAPLYDTLHPGDVLIGLMEAFNFQPTHKAYKDYVVSRWKRLRNFDDLDNEGMVPVDSTEDSKPDKILAGHSSWEKMLIAGGFFKTIDDVKPGNVPSVSRSFEVPAKSEPTQNKGYSLITPLTAQFHDGRGAGYDWLLETPDSLLQTAWEIPVEISQKISTEKGLSNGDLVTLTTESGSLTAAVYVNDDLHDDFLALRFGGRYYSKDYGISTGNVNMLFGDSYEQQSGDRIFIHTSVSLTKKGEGRLTSVSGGVDSEGRYLSLAVGLEALKKGHYPVMTRHGEKFPDQSGHIEGHPVPMPESEIPGKRPHDNIVPLQRHPNHRWGMTIDLDKCTGCGACVVACYAENNIPVVGKDEVSRGRELSWLRIEKHVFRKKGKNVVRFLPVMCQHCDQAPCESVCPVFASYHTPDGLNAQVYNRCIGTRYCANNCPYKVRRFNYFKYEREEPATLQLNPEVTVRSRGVMEKCTFCIQRIREVTNKAKLEGRKVRDQEIIPACMQSCPTGAINFGDLLQPEWEMTKETRDPRGYRLLDYITNTRPGVVYLRKIYTDTENV